MEIKRHVFEGKRMVCGVYVGRKRRPVGGGEGTQVGVLRGLRRPTLIYCLYSGDTF